MGERTKAAGWVGIVCALTCVAVFLVPSTTVLAAKPARSEGSSRPSTDAAAAPRRPPGRRWAACMSASPTRLPGSPGLEHLGGSSRGGAAPARRRREARARAGRALGGARRVACPMTPPARPRRSPARRSARWPRRTCAPLPPPQPAVPTAPPIGRARRPLRSRPVSARRRARRVRRRPRAARRAAPPGSTPARRTTRSSATSPTARTTRRSGTTSASCPRRSPPP